MKILKTQIIPSATLTNRKAFTLIEVMVVMAIIAVLAVLVIGAITVARRTATETQHRSYGRAIQVALEAYYTKNKNYNQTLAAQNFTFASIIAAGAMLDSTQTSLSVDTNGTCGNATAAGGQGGGKVLINATGTAPAYVITPATYDCGAALPNNDQMSAPQ